MEKKETHLTIFMRVSLEDLKLTPQTVYKKDHIASFSSSFTSTSNLGSFSANLT